MDRHTYLSALKRGNDDVYAQVEAEVLSMGMLGTDVIEYAMSHLLKYARYKKKTQLFLCIISFLVVGLCAYYFGIRGHDWLIPCLVIFVMLHLIYAVSKVIERAIGYSRFYERLFSTIVKMDTALNACFLIDLHKHTIDTLHQLYQIKYHLIKSLDHLSREQYYALTWEQRKYIYWLLEDHSRFMFDANLSDRPVNYCQPRSIYDEPLCLAILNLYARVEEIQYRKYIVNLAQFNFEAGTEYVAAFNVKSQAQITVETLKPIQDTNKILLRPSEAPKGRQDLLVPAPTGTEQNSDLLRPSASQSTSSHEDH